MGQLPLKDEPIERAEYNLETHVTERDATADFTRKLAEFMKDAEAITNRLKSRTPQNTANTINAALAGGEFSIAVKELIFSLTKHRIAITAAERDTLARLTEYLEESRFTDMVLALDLDPDDARP